MPQNKQSEVVILPRSRSPSRDKAFEIYKEHGGKVDLVDIAQQLGLPSGTIRGWKNKDGWDDRLSGTLQLNTERSKRAKGGQPANTNAVGHGAPAKNKNAEKHGFFTKWLPIETLAIMESIEQSSPIDLLWDQIMLQYTAIIRSQTLMYVKSQQDKTTELVGESRGEQSSSERFEVQQAWDKQANFLQAQSRAMTTLNGMIKQYEEMLRSHLVTGEQQARIDKLKAEVGKIKGEDGTPSRVSEFVLATKPTAEDLVALYGGEDL